MSIPLTRLYDETNNPYELKLLAGADGLSREVSWVQVMEDSDYASFLLRDELLFTTGMGCKEQENWLHDFIVALMEAGSAGVVINVGKYILREDITDDILDLCNTHHFPLFIYFIPCENRLRLSLLYLSRNGSPFAVPNVTLCTDAAGHYLRLRYDR